MKNKTFYFSSLVMSMLLFLSLLSNNTNAQIIVGPLLPDLQVTSLTITAVDGNAFNFTYKIKNGGKFGPIYLNRFRFQAYVSKDNVLDASDLLAGGSNFGDNAPALSVGQTYSGTLHSASNGSIEEYHYLLFDVKLRTGFTQPEITTSNNRLAKYLTPSFPDLSISNLQLNSIQDGNLITVTYTITNTGKSPLHLDRYGFNVSLSSDEQFEDDDDINAGSSVFTHGAFTLMPGQSHNSIYTAMPGAAVDLNTYSNLYFKVNVLPGKAEPQSNRANDKASLSLASSYADIALNTITVNSINDTTISFNYTIGNNGDCHLYLQKFQMEVFLDAHNLLSSTSVKTDAFRISTSPLVLAPHTTYSSNFIAVIDPTITMSDFHYMIGKLSLLPGQNHPLKNNNNDLLAIYIAPDLDVVFARAVSVTGMNVKAEFSLQNKGYQPIDLDKYNYELFLSKTPYFEPGVEFITEFPLPSGILYPDEYKNSIPVEFTSPLDLNVYHYLIIRPFIKPGEIEVQEYPGTSFYIVNLFTVPFSQRLSYTVAQDEQSVTVTNISGGQINDYVIYSLKGETVAKGTFENEVDIPTHGLHAGMYILHLNNGGVIESHKIIVSK